MTRPPNNQDPSSFAEFKAVFEGEGSDDKQDTAFEEGRSENQQGAAQLCDMFYERLDATSLASSQGAEEEHQTRDIKYGSVIKQGGRNIKQT